MFLPSMKRLSRPSFYCFSTVVFHKGTPEHVKSEDVTLRGVTIKGRFKDLPNLIFFPEACDLVENWIPFFTSNKILDYRNVHILSPRNFGNSDRHQSFDFEEVAKDVQRYMWQNKISTATLAGHGYGAKVALATGCFNAERTTGVFCIDSSPLDHRCFEAFREFRTYIKRLSLIELASKSYIQQQLAKQIECPKWRSIFLQNVKKSAKGEGFEWNFELQYLNKNLSFNQADSIANWPVKCGLYTGRANFIFPEFSRWVHLNTNTIPMMTICPRVRGFGFDVFSMQGDENPLNHWVYDFKDYTYTVSKKFTKFLALYDGVHVLLQDRTEVGNYFIPDRVNSRNDPNYYYQDYSPAHLHHNWRFNEIYKKKE